MNIKSQLKDFVFLSVFGWSYRKGFDILLESYLKEFTDDDPVSLLIVSKYQNNPSKSDFIKRIIDEYIGNRKKTPHISRCSRYIKEDEMPSLYRACDAFVLFSRGEGFCLPYCEASLCGLPVIATNVSGQSMYLNDGNSYLLNPDGFSPIQPGLMISNYWDNQVFPNFTSEESIHEAGKLMRNVFENYRQAKEKNDKLSMFIKKNYSIENVAKMASRLIEKQG